MSPECYLALEGLVTVGHVAAMWLMLSQVVRESLLSVELLLTLTAGVDLFLVLLVVLPDSGQLQTAVLPPVDHTVVADPTAATLFAPHMPFVATGCVAAFAGLTSVS